MLRSFCSATGCYRRYRRFENTDHGLEARAHTDQARHCATPLGSADAWQVFKEHPLQMQKISDEIVGAQSPRSQMILPVITESRLSQRNYGFGRTRNKCSSASREADNRYLASRCQQICCLRSWRAYDMLMGMGLVSHARFAPLRPHDKYLTFIVDGMRFDENNPYGTRECIV